MKYLKLTVLATVLALLAACGAGHPTLKSLQVSPQTAMASSSSHQEVQFTAQGTLDDNSTRELTAVDGVEWASSNPPVASIGDSTGHATCLAPGTVTITASAPADLQLTINNGVNNTSPKVSGAAMLTCT